MDGQKPTETEPATQFVPGDTIRPQQPNTSVDPAPEPATSQLAPIVSASEPAVTVSQRVPQPPVTYEPPAVNDDQTQEPSEAIAWTASEFIAHHKSSGWYALLFLASIVAAFLIWFLTKDVVSAVVVVFAGVMLATYAGRKPRQLSFQLDPSGLTIGQKHYSFNEFRSFSVVPEGAFSSIVFAPHKRFGTLVTIYYDPQDEERIVDAISRRLPHQEHRPDLVDGMMRRIRF